MSSTTKAAASRLVMQAAGHGRCMQLTLRPAEQNTTASGSNESIPIVSCATEEHGLSVHVSAFHLGSNRSLQNGSSVPVFGIIV